MTLKSKKFALAQRLYAQNNPGKNQPMKNGSSKPSQKGKASLESVKNGRTMMLAGNEHNRG